MTTFKEHFSEVQRYNEGYGYAVDAKSVQDAVNKMFYEWCNYSWLTPSMQQRMKRELRENMQNCWVRFQGFQDDDGEFYNTWVITSEYHGGEPRWFHVYSSDYNKHYVEFGHRYEPKADEPGNRVHYSYNEWNCDVCNQINELRRKIKDGEKNV